MKAVEALRYRPNAIARSMMTQRSNMVAIMVANIGFDPEFTAGLCRALMLRGLHALLFTIDHESDADLILDQIWQHRVDGVIAAVQLPVAEVEKLAEREVPLVFINRLYNDQPFNTVCCDQVEGERQLVDRLYRAGHRKFGIVAGPEDSVVSTQRVDGAAGRLRELGVEGVAIVSGQISYATGRKAMRDLISASPEGLNAVVCANDTLAIGCMDEARYGLGMSIPRDLSIVGFNGQTQASWASYDLTTIRQPIAPMVDAAVEMLLARIERRAKGAEKRIFAGELVTGSSARLEPAGAA